MGLPSASGASIKVETEHGEWHLSRLTMRQMGELGAELHKLQLERMRSHLAAEKLTPGQRLIALREFEASEPTYHEIVRWGQTPLGVLAVLVKALQASHSGSTEEDLRKLGHPLDLVELAADVMELKGIGEEITDPLSATPSPKESTTGEQTPPSSVGSTEE